MSQRGKKFRFPDRGRNSVGKTWVGRATEDITFKVEQ